MSDPFCLSLIEGQPGSGDRVEVAARPWAVPSTWLCPLEKLLMTSCKAVVFRFFALPTAPCKELLVPVPASVPLPCLFKEGGSEAASPPCGVRSSRWSVNNEKVVWCYS